MHGPGPPLEVKVFVPGLPPGTVVRRRLDTLLDRAVGHRLTTMIAGAGLGKTTALAHWAAQRPVAWYTASRDDLDAPTFAAGLAAAIRLRAPTLELALPQTQGEAPDDDRAAEERAVAIASALAAAVQVAAPETLLIVIDDVHELAPGSGGAALLDALVRQLPDRAHVVLAGRDGPPFTITRLLTRGHAIAFGATELAFDETETAAVLGATLGATAADEGIGRMAATLQERTGGWPAAVRLAAELLRAEPPASRPDALSAALHQAGPVAGPLVAEVLEREADEDVGVLGRLAHLDRFTTELAEIVAGPEAPRVIASLAPRGVQLVGLGGAWWTVHPLLRDELRARVAPPDEGRLRAAARWSAEHGRVGDALRLLTAAGDAEELATVLGRYGASAIAAGHASAVVEAADSLPDWLRSAAIDTVDGQARQAIGDWEGALDRLARVSPTDGPIAAGVAWRVGIIHHFRGELDAAVQVYERGADGALRDRALLAAWHAAARWRRGERDACARLAAEAETLARAADDRQALAAAHTALALLAALDGDRAANDAHYLRALDHATAAGDLLQVIRIRTNRGSHDLEEGRYAEALVELDEAIRLADITGFASFGTIALSNRAEVLFHLGRLDEAHRDVAAAIEMAQRVGSRLVAYPLSHLADVHAMRGDLAQARAAYDEAIATAREVGDVQGFVPPLSGLARLLAAAGELPEARACIDELLAAPTSLSEATALVAATAVAHAEGRTDDAIEHARCAVALARDRRDRPSLAAALEQSAALTASTGSDPRPELHEAQAIFADLGELLGLARVELALARVSPPDEARVLAGRARQTFRRLGARPLAAQATALLADLDRADTPDIAIRALGEFSVHRTGTPIPRTAWQSRKARDLLKALVVRRGRPAHREELVSLLWPDEDPGKAGARLSVALSTARAVLDPDKRWPPDHVLSADGPTVQLRREHVWIDVEAFLSAADDALRAHRGRDTTATERLVTADSLYTGDLLEEDRYEDWPVPLREELRLRYLEVNRALADRARAEGDHDAAVRALLRLLEHDAYDESAHLLLSATLSAAGRHGEARRAHSTYCARMAELGVEPAPFPGASDHPNPA